MSRKTVRHCLPISKLLTTPLFLSFLDLHGDELLAVATYKLENSNRSFYPILNCVPGTLQQQFIESSWKCYIWTYLTDDTEAQGVEVSWPKSQPQPGFVTRCTWHQSLHLPWLTDETNLICQQSSNSCEQSTVKFSFLGDSDLRWINYYCRHTRLRRHSSLHLRCGLKNTYMYLWVRNKADSTGDQNLQKWVLCPGQIVGKRRRTEA